MNRNSPSPPHESVEAGIPNKAATGQTGVREPDWVAEILGSADMLKAEEFAILAGVSPQSINAWRRRGEVLALRSEVRSFRYPKWQIGHDGGVLPGLKDVARELKEPCGVLTFEPPRFHPKLMRDPDSPARAPKPRPGRPSRSTLPNEPNSWPTP